MPVRIRSPTPKPNSAEIAKKQSCSKFNFICYNIAMIFEGLCGIGGRAAIDEEEWVADPYEEISYSVTPVLDDTKTTKAACLPENCRFTKVCTHKVHAVKPEDNGFSVATISEIRYKNSALETELFAQSEADLS